LRLPARVFNGPALGLSDVALIKLASGAQAEIGIAGIRDPPSKLGNCDTKLYKAYDEPCDV
jgi:hypothetical protein